MMKQATAAYHLLQVKFYSKYPTVADVSPDRVAELLELQKINRSVFEQAETLG